MMTSKEKFNQKVWFVLLKIEDSSNYDDKRRIFKYWIKSSPNLNTETMPSTVEEREIINKLQEQKAINIISEDIAEVSDSEIAFSKGLNVTIVILYLKKSKEFNKTYKKFEELCNNRKDVLYTIKYDNREIVINNIYFLCRPRHMGTNDLVFSYLYERHGQSFTKKEIETAICKTLGKTTFNTILNNLGFKKGLRAIFFPGVSQDGITFKNHITKKDLVNLKIDENKVNMQLKKLKILNT